MGLHTRLACFGCDLRAAVKNKGLLSINCPSARYAASGSSRRLKKKNGRSHFEDEMMNVFFFFLMNCLREMLFFWPALDFKLDLN